jgi:hypothetical protein
MDSGATFWQPTFKISLWLLSRGAGHDPNPEQPTFNPTIGIGKRIPPGFGGACQLRKRCVDIESKGKAAIYLILHASLETGTLSIAFLDRFARHERNQAPAVSPSPPSSEMRR